MRKLLTGNEAIARGAWEAGVKYASAYPGTPSTEILETTALYVDDILAEWAPNEKVAIEAVIGASFAGARTFAAMKHVGVNVAADPLFTFSYTGVNGGMVLISADEPGYHSSQNEQDNRNYAKFAKIPMLEPSDSQESKDMMKSAFSISEKYNTPVLLRMTTRVCHSKSIVECGERDEVGIMEYTKSLDKFPIPAFVGGMRARVEERQVLLKDFSNQTELNFFEWNDCQVGVIASGACYKYAKEVFGDTVSYLKLGFTNPLPDEKIREFCSKVEKVYVIEEVDPYIEEVVRILGFDCFGKNLFPNTGEMTPDTIRKAIYGKTFDHVETEASKVVPRPPILCAGCPHRGFFVGLKNRKNIVVASDIGCYSLGFADPYKVGDWCVCMGASMSSGHGAQQVFDMVENSNKRVVSILGDSTFLHSGMNSLLDVVYNGSKTVNVILDNRITGMTGHQENPASGYTLQGKKTKEINLEKLVRALGFEHVMVINPNDITAVQHALDWALSLDEASVIITRWPCVLKTLSTEDKNEFKEVFKNKCTVLEEKCTGCRACIRTGCPALFLDKANKKVSIDVNSCVGCEVCLQVCKLDAIVKVGV
ncbi:MAG: Thiamine pyrophosphate protein domain protein TPP-binding [Bacillales bacterium]|jgi:indolepyruvate ferredoxin oxidoreductase alpha subunit|nr:Thiamine pyrophosphate protein domain protein TPP-binding [Bacillales bacterium]